MDKLVYCIITVAQLEVSDDQVRIDDVFHHEGPFTSDAGHRAACQLVARLPGCDREGL